MLGYERETFTRATVISATAPASSTRTGSPSRFGSSRTATGRPTSTSRPACSARQARRARPISPGSSGARRETWPPISSSWLGDAPAARVRLGPAQEHVPAQPRRPRRAALLAADRRTQKPARRRPAVVHDHVRARQHLHQPAGAAVHARAGGDDAARARRAAGHAHRRLPRRGPRPDPARDALRRDDRVRGATALAVLRQRRRHAAVRRAARRVRALDRRPEARPRARARGAGRAELDRRVRRPPGQRLRLVPAAQRGDRPREPVLEGLLGLDLLPRRPASRASRARPASSRATRTTPRCAARGSRARSGTTRRSPTQLEKQAADLKRRFNRDFWVDDGEYFALALDADGTQVDALTSNNGHLLWSGIVDKSKAKAVVRHLMGDAAVLRLGRAHARGGRRRATTRSATTSAPIWPFDNSFIAWGLRRYGFKDEAARLAAGILDAAEFFDGRLPEAFGGYPRSAHEVPRAVPDRVQPAGVVDRRAAPVPAHDARPGAARRPPRRRPGAAAPASATSSCSTSRALGPRRRLRPRTGHDRGRPRPTSSVGTDRQLTRQSERRSSFARLAVGHGHEVAGVVYGTVVAMATLTAAYATVKDPWRLAAIVWSTLFVLWVAHLYAHGLGESIAHGRRLDRAELKSVARRELGILLGGSRPEPGVAAGGGRRLPPEHGGMACAGDRSRDARRRRSALRATGEAGPRLDACRDGGEPCPGAARGRSEGGRRPLNGPNGSRLQRGQDAADEEVEAEGEGDVAAQVPAVVVEPGVEAVDLPDGSSHAQRRTRSAESRRRRT